MLALAFLLSACSPSTGPANRPGQAGAVQETTPVVTVELDSQPSSTPLPLSASTPAIVIEPPVAVPTPTFPPPSVGVGQEELAVFSPGPGSMVTAPINLQGYGGPSLNNRVELRLIGEDGRMISRGSTVLYSYPGRPGLFYGKIPFETQAVAEQAWIQIRSYGLRFGLLKHLTTVPVTLLTSGSERIETSLHGPEKITIFTPREETRVQSPHIVIEGAAWTEIDTPLGVEVLDLRGTVLASTEVDVDAPQIGALGTFRAELELQLPVSQWVRIAVYERNGDIPGVIHYSSVQVWLVR